MSTSRFGRRAGDKALPPCDGAGGDAATLAAEEPVSDHGAERGAGSTAPRGVFVGRRAIRSSARLRAPSELELNEPVLVEYPGASARTR